MAIISIPTSVAGVALPGSLGGLAKGPLSALFAGNGVQTLQYPSDLATIRPEHITYNFPLKKLYRQVGLLLMESFLVLKLVQEVLMLLKLQHHGPHPQFLVLQHRLINP